MQLLQPDLAGVHRPQPGAGDRRRMDPGHPRRRLRSLRRHLPGAFRSPDSVRDGIPAAAARRRVPLDHRHRTAHLRPVRRVCRLHRFLPRHHRPTQHRGPVARTGNTHEHPARLDGRRRDHARCPWRTPHAQRGSRRDPGSERRGDAQLGHAQRPHHLPHRRRRAGRHRANSGHAGAGNGAPPGRHPRHRPQGRHPALAVDQLGPPLRGRLRHTARRGDHPRRHHRPAGQRRTIAAGLDRVPQQRRGNHRHRRTTMHPVGQPGLHRSHRLLRRGSHRIHPPPAQVRHPRA